LALKASSFRPSGIYIDPATPSFCQFITIIIITIIIIIIIVIVVLFICYKNLSIKVTSASARCLYLEPLKNYKT